MLHKFLIIVAIVLFLAACSGKQIDSTAGADAKLGGTSSVTLGIGNNIQ